MFIHDADPIWTSNLVITEKMKGKQNTITATFFLLHFCIKNTIPDWRALIFSAAHYKCIISAIPNTSVILSTLNMHIDMCINMCIKYAICA